MPREDDTHVKVTGVRLPAPLLTGPQARNDWIRWKEDWQDYAIVQDLHSKPDAVQCSLFRMALGTDGKKLLRSQPMPKKPDGTPMDPNKLATLLETMKIAIVGEVNVTYELYVFQTRVQQKGEPFDEFLLALRELMKTCDFCEHMTDHMLKSQVIRGVREDATRERLLQERQLTLAKCVDMCRAAESASTQARDMASGTNADVNWVSRYGKTHVKKFGRKPHDRIQKQGQNRPEKKECRFCGRWHEMSPGVCPALGKTCGKCGQLNHFAKKCNRKVHQVDEEITASDAADMFYTDEEIGAVTHHVYGISTNPRAKLRIQGKTKAFLLDTGASANLISSHDVDTRKLKVTTPRRTFTMWNGSTQRAIGRAAIPVYNPVTHKTYDVDFDVVPAKLAPILGCSTVQAMGLVQVNSSQYEGVGNVQPVLKTKADYINEYAEVFKKDIGTLEGCVTLQVNPHATPAILPARKVPIALTEPVKQELKRLQQLKVITPVTSPTDWVSQLVTVHKSDNSVRLCLDPRPLNEALQRERYHLPTFEEVLPDLNNAKVFSKVDLRSGYWHVQLDEKSSLLTCFQSQFGRFKWNRLPFGLSVSSEIFARKVYEALDGLEGVFCIADDIVIAGVGTNTEEANRSHDDRLQALLQRCKDKGIVLNEQKFVLRESKLVFMGHVISNEGISPDPAKVQAIKDMPNPTDATGARRFLGMIQFLAKFIPNISSIVKPIQALTGKDVVWHWATEHDEAVRRVKALICTAPVLVHFDHNKELMVQSDAAKDGLGSVLMQDNHPIAYASRALTTAEIGYAQIEKELLSVVFSLEKFHQYTYGRRVLVQNDHKPLVTIQRKPYAKAPMRLQRMLMRLQKYDYEIVHVPGKDMHVADALSRATIRTNEPVQKFDDVNTVVTSDLTTTELVELQTAIREDKQMTRLLQVIREGWPHHKTNCDTLVTPYWDYRDELSIYDDILVKGLALVIPRKLRSKYMKLAHGAHMGADSCIRRARDTIFWPGMAADIRSTIEKCETCARYAPHQQKEPLCQPETPNKAWSCVSADNMTLDGKEYLVTVDALSGFFEVDLLRHQTAQEVIMKLRMHFARYGSPNKLITDNGPPYASERFRQFAQDWRFEHRTSSPHHPRSNGQAEAAVKMAKAIIRKVQREKGDVYKALLDYRNTPRATTGLSPSEVLMQRRTRTATLPQTTIPSANEHQAHDKKDKRQKQVKDYHDKTAAPLPPIPVGTRVWYARWQGNRESWAKGQVTEVRERSYIITANNGTHYRRNRIQVKPDLTHATGDDDAEDEIVIETRTRPPTADRREAGGYGFVPPKQTTSGRLIRPARQ